MINIELLKNLCNTSGISGDEGEVRSAILEEIKDLTKNIKVDALGNIIALKKGKKSAKQKLMLCAHMDEVGFIVTDINEDGFLKFESVGGINSNSIISRSVSVGKNKIKGVIGTKPVHLVKKDEINKPVSISEMYIDIGAKDKNDAQKYVSYGDSISFDNSFEYSNGIIKSKAIDDRVGCAILIEIMKRDLPVDMYFTFTTQEEIGLRGAKVCSYNVDPDSAIVVEGTTAADVFNINKDEQVCKLNSGAVISFMDKRTVYDKSYFELACKIAKKEEISYQIKRAVAGGNDAGAIQASRSGVKTIALSVPCRYIHTAESVANENDVNAVYKLAFKLACKIAQSEENK